MLKAANAATCCCVTPVSPLLGLGTGMSLSPCFYLALGMPQGTMLIFHTLPTLGWLTSHFLFHLIPIITFTFFFSNFVFPNR